MSGEATSCSLKLFLVSLLVKFVTYLGKSVCDCEAGRPWFLLPAPGVVYFLALDDQ